MEWQTSIQISTNILYLELHGSGGGKNDDPREMLFRGLYHLKLKGVLISNNWFFLN